MSCDLCCNSVLKVDKKKSWKNNYLINISLAKLLCIFLATAQWIESWSLRRNQLLPSAGNCLLRGAAWTQCLILGWRHFSRSGVTLAGTPQNHLRTPHVGPCEGDSCGCASSAVVLGTSSTAGGRDTCSEPCHHQLETQVLLWGLCFHKGFLKIWWRQWMSFCWSELNGALG